MMFPIRSTGFVGQASELARGYDISREREYQLYKFKGQVRATHHF